jgi:RNA polymerase sigma-70 factor (ECF subfamily)
MTASDSFRDLMAKLTAGDDTAATVIFHRYAQRLIALAGSRLGEPARHKEDPEDVVQSVFRSFFLRQREGQFYLADWDTLWSMLTLITVRKCVNRIENFRAESRDVTRETAPAVQQPAAEALTDEPLPEEAAALTDTVEQLMRALVVEDREVLTLQLQGYTIPEISREVKRSERTVSRVLGRIRRRCRHLLTADQP